MNTKQQKFVTEYLQWGIPALAYANAYNKSDPNGRAIESAANRLMRNPEVKQAIHDAEDRIRHQVEREIADRQVLDVFTIEQKRHLLKQIATGDMLVEQRYKTGDCRHCTQFIRPTINQMLRAIDLDNRMAAHYPPPQQKTTTKREIISPLGRSVSEPSAQAGWVHSRSTDNTTPEQLQPNAVSSLPPLKKTSTLQQNTTSDNKTENTGDKNTSPLGRGEGGHSAQAGWVHSRSTDNTSPETCPPQAGVSAAADGGGTPAPDTPEQQTTSDNISPLGVGGNLAQDTPEQQQPNAVSSLPPLKKTSTLQQNTTTDNTSPLPGDLGVITHDELMELLYPEEEKLQHFTTTGLKRNRL